MKTAAPRCGAYLLLTFTLSWTLWAPLVLLGGRLPAALDFTLLLAGSLVPSTIGIILTGVEDGARGMRHPSQGCEGP